MMMESHGYGMLHGGHEAYAAIAAAGIVTL
jgi:hypothetical protein